MKKIILTAFLSIVCLTTVFAARPGKLVHETIMGVRTLIWLHPDYKEEGSYNPTLYLLHGTPGNEYDWWEKGNLEYILDSIMNEGDIIDMVIVMPNIIDMSLPTELQEQYQDGRLQLSEAEMDAVCQNGLMEERMADYVHYMEYHYNLSPSMRERGLAGISMGAFHSLHMGHYLTYTFDYFGLFSPIYEPRIPAGHEWPEAYKNMYPETKELFEMKPTYWIGIGRQDALYDETQQYRKWLEKNGCEYVYYENEGGHDWTFWQDCIARFFIRVFKVY